VIIVDAGSTDGTGGLANRRARSLPGLRVVQHSTNLGLAAGYQAALAAARMPFFTFVPGDREVAAESIRRIQSAAGTAA
jgi:glycosyltransferase involved in cell wall biosynthesis